MMCDQCVCVMSTLVDGYVTQCYLWLVVPTTSYIHPPVVSYDRCSAALG